MKSARKVSVNDEKKIMASCLKKIAHLVRAAKSKSSCLQDKMSVVRLVTQTPSCIASKSGLSAALHPEACLQKSSEAIQNFEVIFPRKRKILGISSSSGICECSSGCHGQKNG